MFAEVVSRPEQSMKDTGNSMAVPATLVGSIAIQRGRLTNEQISAIKLAAEIGADIRRSLPEIAEEYRNGLTAPSSQPGTESRTGIR